MPVDNIETKGKIKQRWRVKINSVKVSRVLTKNNALNFHSSIGIYYQSAIIKKKNYNLVISNYTYVYCKHYCVNKLLSSSNYSYLYYKYLL